MNKIKSFETISAKGFRENVCLEKDVRKLESDYEELEAENKKLLEDREILLKRSIETIAEISELNNKLMTIKIQIEKHRVWTGQNWKQNHLADFVAEKILKIIEKESKITCTGAGQCDYNGIGCNENNNCGEYVRKNN